jgi:hypothetical protein
MNVYHPAAIPNNEVNMIFKNVSEIQSAIRAQITARPEQAQKAMMKIFANQTEDEQQAEATNHHNNVGFTGQDAKILSSFAKQYQRKGWLSDKQNAILMKKIGKYAGQLTRQAIDKGVYVKAGSGWIINK